MPCLKQAFIDSKVELPFFADMAEKYCKVYDIRWYHLLFACYHNDRTQSVTDMILGNLYALDVEDNEYNDKEYRIVDAIRTEWRNDDGSTLERIFRKHAVDNEGTFLALMSTQYVGRFFGITWYHLLFLRRGYGMDNERWLDDTLHDLVHGEVHRQNVFVTNDAISSGVRPPLKSFVLIAVLLEVFQRSQSFEVEFRVKAAYIMARHWSLDMPTFVDMVRGDVGEYLGISAEQTAFMYPLRDVTNVCLSS